jgi:membrane protease YdiL (CAAX protease family)
MDTMNLEHSDGLFSEAKMSEAIVNELQNRPVEHIPGIEWLKGHSVAFYYFLALALSWLVELPLVAVKQGWIDLPISFAVHYLAAFGPMLAALIVTVLTSGRDGLKELWGRLTRWRVGWNWALFSIFSPVVIFALSMPVVWLVKGEWPDLRLLGQANYLPYLGIWVLPVWLATYGFGEEIGWRGFVLPRLQRTMSVSRATLILGLMWIIWHVPAFFYLDTYQGIGWFVLPGFVFGVLCGAVIFTWIYNSTGGSVLMVAVWHGVFDLFTASKAGQDIIPFIMSALVILGALVLTNLDRPWNFYHLKKHVI